MKDETRGVAIEEFIGLKAKVYLFLVDDNSECEKVKVVNRNIDARKVITNIKMYC